MKRILGIMVGAATVGVAVYLGSQLWAQPGAAPSAHPAASAAPKTRLALLNLSYVVKNYSKFKNYMEELKKDSKVYEDKLQGLAKKGEDTEKLKVAATDPAQRDNYERDLKTLKRQMQDIQEEGRNAVLKKESDQLVIIYKEIAGAVAAFAQANDIDVVLHYNDGTTTEEMNSAHNIQRKMMLGACIPVYYKAQEVDISYPVLEMLNKRYTASAPAAATTPGGN